MTSLTKSDFSNTATTGERLKYIFLQLRVGPRPFSFLQKVNANQQTGLHPMSTFRALTYNIS